uniref:NADH-ubiquinone oxidoreductase chain 5 n=1 Tax=Crangon hakodatei TaxID=1884866 RepID=A0A1C9CY33_9EUCA|nr:NADH dehydrogenase subunit 5 [Crangon hakodatei]
MSWGLKLYLTGMFYMFITSVSSFITSLYLLKSDKSWMIEWEIISMNSSSLEFVLIFDWMSTMFISFVSLISSMVLYYSGSYMHGDKHEMRFMYMVLGFVFSMFFMILSPNLVSILLGWDGLGLTSYALVIYYQSEKSANAGMLTALSNRVGDVAILMGIAVLSDLGSWNFLSLNAGTPASSGLLMSLIILAGMTKSAQIPFSAWLPAAMAAPTPVSALVHSSTLVTAGVYLLIRLSPFINGSFQESMLFLIGSLTMFMAGLCANFEMDLKKIIALSTLSQLGVMMSILGLGWPELAFFHLLAHALFKALLFMCAGSVIHATGGGQDIRSMGSLVYFMPLSVMNMNLANLALCGAPFLAGFYSKDLILEVAFLNPLNTLSLWIYLLATGLTVCYTFRLMFYTLSGGWNLNPCGNIDDSAKLITRPMEPLATGAILGGAMMSWLLFPAPSMICLSTLFKSLTLLVMCIGGLIGYLVNLTSENHSLMSLKFYNYVSFLGGMWFMPYLSSYFLSKSTLPSGFNYISLGDSGWSEFYGGQGAYKIFMKSSYVLQKMQENNLKLYLLMFVFWVIMLMLLI